jgi:hypothetical protein
MDFKFLIVIFTILLGIKDEKKDLLSCVPPPKTNILQIDKELDYVKTKANYISNFESLMKPNITDSLIKMDNRAVADLEKRLLEILKPSKLSTQGKINLVTLLPYADFGLLDGLSFRRDSLTIVYTTKTLFYEFFKDQGITEIQDLSPNNLADIFTAAFITDAHCYNFSYFRLDEQSGYRGYGMIGAGTNGFGPIPADYLYALVSKDKYIYLASKKISKFKELPKCRALWDSFDLGNQSIASIDSTLEKYATCYQEQLKYDGQFKIFQKQIEEMANYLEK